MNIVRMIKKLFKKKPKQRTLQETIDFINKEYHFNNYQEELIDEIYTLLMPYEITDIHKEDTRHFILSVQDKIYNITEDGMFEDVSEDGMFEDVSEEV